MEKKSNSRSSQSQTKTQTSDSKKTQDASVNKPWPRSSKKRESPSNGSSRNDTNRKLPPQKGKCFDKRPKPRGTYHGGLLGGKPDPRLEEEGAEVGSVFLPGSKKQNLNHLLNFQYTSREAGGAPRVPGGRRPHGLVYTNTHKHSKELFLQSNCQFVVRGDGDYAAHLVDPDVPVNWDLVEQINVRVSEALTCPICLGEVVAGRITRCGHTYCWPCLLHYFALSEDSARPCPICFQPIDKKHLRSVQGVWQENIPLDGEMHLRLMRRAIGSTLVEPAPPLEYVALEGDDSQGREILLSVSEMHRTTLYSKLLTANPQEVMNIINREREELSTQLVVESDNPEYCFIQDALNQLQARESNLLSVQTNVEPEDTLKTPQQEFNPNNGSGGLSFIDLMEDLSLNKLNNFPGQNSAKGLSLNPDAAVFKIPSSGDSVGEASESSNVIPCQPIKKRRFFYFYQASDGQAVFLEGLDVRILEASWGSLSRSPRDLRGAVVRRISGSVDEESRRRLRCLRHLPLHCPYDMVQLDLQPPFVILEALYAFKGDLEERKRQRARKIREEKRLERVISRQEEALMGRGGPGLKLSIHSEQHFPAYLPDPLAEQNFPPHHQGYLERSEDESPTTSSSISEPSNMLHNSLSFAKMASGSGSWKSRAPVQPGASAPGARHDSECSEGEAGAAPSYHVSLSEAIAVALSNAPLAADTQRPAPREGKNKKKLKAKVLFSTGIQHRTQAN